MMVVEAGGVRENGMQVNTMIGDESGPHGDKQTEKQEER